MFAIWLEYVLCIFVSSPLSVWKRTCGCNHICRSDANSHIVQGKCKHSFYLFIAIVVFESALDCVYAVNRCIDTLDVKNTIKGIIVNSLLALLIINPYLKPVVFRKNH